MSTYSIEKSFPGKLTDDNISMVTGLPDKCMGIEVLFAFFRVISFHNIELTCYNQLDDSFIVVDQRGKIQANYRLIKDV